MLNHSSLDVPNPMTFSLLRSSGDVSLSASSAEALSRFATSSLDSITAELRLWDSRA